MIKKSLIRSKFTPEFRVSNDIKQLEESGIWQGGSSIIRLILRWMQKLKSLGNVYRIEDAIGQEGFVYKCIPKGGTGKISIWLNQLTYEIDAVSDHDEIVYALICNFNS